jgi:GNAT superfamily N-acetyltransferase
VLEEGAGVVTSRGDVHYVVTEHGVADLWGKNVRQRATALIEIAHPDFRAELLAEAKARRYVFPDQIAPRGPYPWEEAREATLPKGEVVLVRPVRLSDEEGLQDMLYRLSDESTYRRFFGFKRSHPHEEMLELCDFSYEDNAALVVCAPAEGRDSEGELIALARYDVEPSTRLADVAFVVRDDWQGRGIGTLLMKRMAEIAKARGVLGFTADVLASNKPMMMVFQNSGLHVHADLSDGVYHLVACFDPATPVPARS